MTRSNTPAPVTTETAAFARQLLGRLGSDPLTLGNATTGENTPLPPHLADLIHEVLRNLAKGTAVAVTDQPEEMTPNEAAEFLNISRPSIVKLMDAGTLPYREVGSHRRIPFADLSAYRDQQAARSRIAMDELVALSQEMGLYDDLGPPPPKSVFKGTGRSK